MIFPDDYKCLVCKFRYYGCKHKKDFKRMLSCVHFQKRETAVKKYTNLALARCLFGVCPRVIVQKLYNS